MIGFEWRQMAGLWGARPRTKPAIFAFVLQRCLSFLLIGVLLCRGASAQHSSYQYFRIGQKSDAQTDPGAGYALMGGGKDLDDAFRWLCAKANGGDFLVLRAAGDDDYNAYVNGLCKLNSVATLIIPDRNAAQDPSIANIIRHAEAVFIAGGDQAHYIRAWQDTPVQRALNEDIANGNPLEERARGWRCLGNLFTLR
jgi:cyanophycinase